MELGGRTCDLLTDESDLQTRKFENHCFKFSGLAVGYVVTYIEQDSIRKYF